MIALTTVPRSPVRTAAARTLFVRAVAALPVRVVLPDRELGLGGPHMRILRPQAFFGRLGAEGLIGFGESYMAGDWQADDLAGLLTVFADRVGTLVPPKLQRLRHLALRRQPEAERGDLEGARRNVQRHYDLSNDLFALFLDETMTYSAALFPEDPAGRPLAADLVAADLVTAQHRKIDRLLDLTGVGPGTHVLEIGTGWGELALRAGARGATVRSVTLSAEQRALAVKRIAGAGLTDQVTVDLCDYREVTGQYDAIVSVEMIEAVGERYWPRFFAAIDALLAPGGRVGIQSITMPHDRLMASRNTHTWVQKYIFPGGLIPSVPALRTSLSTTSLHLAGGYSFGLHYAETLKLWRERFDAADLGPLGFDHVFRRMWELYLAYSEAGFRSGYLDVQQFLLTRRT
ncbi:MAG: cyclopropane-fatty-acyl-phospholipid synthase family protein [Streptosporangiaceae bacterium]